MAQFKVGDVVQMKSGGPKMTIEHIYNANGTSPIDSMLYSPYMVDGTICVYYFDEISQDFAQKQFIPEILKLVE